MSADVSHISEMLQDEMNARGWSRQDVYERLGYDSTDCSAFDLLMDVHDKNHLMSKREDQALADAFGIDDPGFFIRVYDAWRTHPDTQDQSNIVKFGR